MSFEKLIDTMLRRMPNMTKHQGRFLRNQLALILMIPIRCNYLSFARYGKYNEATYRNHYNNDKIDFAEFNYRLISKHTSTDRIIAFDPSFIKKSGHDTPGVDKFWSGCHRKMMHGKELCGLAVVDLDANEALHFVAEQTMPETGETKIDFYFRTVKKHHEKLLKLSRYLAVDAYFAKEPFIRKSVELGFYIVTRLRTDAAIYYVKQPNAPRRPGPEPKKGARINTKDIDVSQLPAISKTDKEIVYGGLIYVESLGYEVMANILQILNEDGSVETALIYICTDTKVAVEKVRPMYKGRFHIEFLNRDSKQYAGLEESQSRTKDAIDYHYNASMTAVSAAKVAYHLSKPKEERGAFSMASITIELANRDLINRVFDLVESNPNITRHDKLVENLCKLGKIA